MFLTLCALVTTHRPPINPHSTYFTPLNTASCPSFLPISQLPPPSSAPPQNAVQGPFPWDNLDTWLINKFVSEDLQVKPYTLSPKP